MATPARRKEFDDRKETFEAMVARLRATPQERARILASAPMFDYEAWARQVGEPSPEELAEMEEFLRERDEERKRSLAAEAERLPTARE